MSDRADLVARLRRCSVEDARYDPFGLISAAADMLEADKALPPTPSGVGAGEGERHDFLRVRWHDDDDECTHRADGTDATYCGRPEADSIHAPVPTQGEEAERLLVPWSDVIAAGRRYEVLCLVPSWGPTREDWPNAADMPPVFRDALADSIIAATVRMAPSKDEHLSSGLGL